VKDKKNGSPVALSGKRAADTRAALEARDPSPLARR